MVSTYNCRGAINGIIVQNNPVNWIDPEGLVNSGEVTTEALKGAVVGAYTAGKVSKSWYGAAIGAVTGGCASGTKNYLEQRGEDKRAAELEEDFPVEEPPGIP